MSAAIAVESKGPVPARGLSGQEAEERLSEYGPNEPAREKEAPLWRQVLGRFANPLVLVLLLASGASAVLGDLTNAAIVLVIVLMSLVLELVQTRRSARAAASLKARVGRTATALRDGRWQEIARRDLVPGDVVRLSAGDMVPADGALLEARDLHLNEAALTGESLPVEKGSGASVMMGSSIVSGTGTALVDRTGSRTAFGDIARVLAARPPPTEFEQGITRFGVFIMKTVFFLVLVVFLVNAALHRNALESLLFGVALAVGLTPEFLPMITTVTLTRGAQRMAKRSVIVKNLAAIQNLGSMDILCSDKTGTITTGEMTLERHVDARGRTAERPLLLGYLNSYFESGVENPVDSALLRKGRLDPLDSAVLGHEHPDISGFTKVDEVPFDFERRRVSVVAARDRELLLVTKGAPEHVLGVCCSVELDGTCRPLDDDSRALAASTFEKLGKDGYRVLGVAYRVLEPGRAFTKADEQDLVFAGFLAFGDPPREDAAEVLEALRAAGVRVKVLTGDGDGVARHIAARVGLAKDAVLTGADIEKMSDPALGNVAERTDIFARVSPSQKNRILRALKARGHAVGFLGDGINDAPSLHTADVGISVASAVDVAKDAADVILLEPGLGVVLAGIVEGRKAFGNVMKYLLMGTSSNFGNMVSMAGASALLPFLPMLPTQVLLNNFLYDLAQVTIPSDTVDPEFIRAPRRWDVRAIRRFMLFIGPVSSAFDVLTFFVLMRGFHASEALFHSGWFVESLVTQTLVIFVIRTARSPFSHRPSPLLTAATCGIVLFGIALPFTPLATSLGFVPLPLVFFPFLLGIVSTYLVCVEAVKRAVLRPSASGFVSSSH